MHHGSICVPRVSRHQVVLEVVSVKFFINFLSGILTVFTVRQYLAEFYSMVNPKSAYGGLIETAYFALTAIAYFMIFVMIVSLAYSQDDEEFT